LGFSQFFRNYDNFPRLLTRTHPISAAHPSARRSTRLRPHGARSPLTPGPALNRGEHPPFVIVPDKAPSRYRSLQRSTTWTPTLDKRLPPGSTAGRFKSACEWPITSSARYLHTAQHQRCSHVNGILPSWRRTGWVRAPTAAYPTHRPAHVSYAARTIQYPTHIRSRKLYHEIKPYNL
jgi:hypothetical protein